MTYITFLLKKHIESWLEHDVKTLAEINQGYCADFADSFIEKSRDSKLTKNELSLVGLYVGEDIKSQGFDKYPKPTWIKWSNFLHLLELGCFNHTFLKYNDKFYDCEEVAGVLSPFDLPIFKRAANEYKYISDKNIK